LEESQKRSRIAVRRVDAEERWRDAGEVEFVELEEAREERVALLGVMIGWWTVVRVVAIDEEVDFILPTVILPLLEGGAGPDVAGLVPSWMSYKRASNSW
jgi:hypothetical protein